jgi:hypothetical protein
MCCESQTKLITIYALLPVAKIKAKEVLGYNV